MPFPTPQVCVFNTAPEHFDGISELCRRIYPDTPPWNAEQLSSHLRVFPEGQCVAVLQPGETVVGMAASLIVDWDDYNMLDDWERFTADGMFTNHDPVRGRTLYGAEVIVDPTLQHHGIGDKLYGFRRNLTESMQVKTNSRGRTVAWLLHLRCRSKARRIRHRGRGRASARSDAQLSIAGRLSCSGSGSALLEGRSREPGICRRHRMAQSASHPAGTFCRPAHAIPAQGRTYVGKWSGQPVQWRLGLMLRIRS